MAVPAHTRRVVKYTATHIKVTYYCEPLTHYERDAGPVPRLSAPPMPSEPAPPWTAPEPTPPPRAPRGTPRVRTGPPLGVTRAHVTHRPSGVALPTGGPAWVAGRPCLVVDLDETLVHTEALPFDGSVAVDVDGDRLFVAVRPHAAAFMEAAAEMFEVVAFTAGFGPYADSVVRLLEGKGRKVLFHHRRWRDHCTVCTVHTPRKVYTALVKDLSELGRPLEKVCIVDNSPMSYAFHPENALPVTSWRGEPDDDELLTLIKSLEAFALVGNVSALREQ